MIILAASNNERVDVAKVAYDAQSFDDFKAWWETHPATDKDGKVKTNKQGEPEMRVLSWSANANNDDEGLRAFYDTMHSAVVRSYKSAQDTGYDADLALFTRYAIQFTLAYAAQGGEVDEAVRQALLDDREARRQAQADRMSGLAGTNQTVVKQGSAAKDLIASLIASGDLKLDKGKLAELGLA